jgi:hypothetical protein
MTTTTVRPRMQDLVKQALAEGAARAEVGRRAKKDTCDGCGKDKASCTCGTKSAEQAQKLAAAIEHIAELLAKEGEAGPGEGAGALGVTETQSSGTLPHDKGKSHLQPPRSTLQTRL